MPDMHPVYGGADLVKERLDLIKRVEADDDSTILTPRVDMTSPEKRSKLRRYKNTGNPKFNSLGTDTYTSLRRDLFEIYEAAGILDDLLFNYYTHDGEGLVARDGFGPYNFGKKILAANPYGLSMRDCEKEANTILNNMIVPGPVATQLKKCEQRNSPTLFVLSFFDQKFFSKDSIDVGNLRAKFLAITFDDSEHPADTLFRMTAAQSAWEEALEYFHEPHEELQFLNDALRSGNLLKHMRRMIDEVTRNWTETGKSLRDRKARDKFTSIDVEAFSNKLVKEYEQLLFDGHISPAVRKVDDIKPHAHLSQAELLSCANHGIDPTLFLSMRNSKSGEIENDNPAADERLEGDRAAPTEYRNRTPARTPAPAPAPAPRKQAAAPAPAPAPAKVSGDKKKPLPSFTDDEECRRRDTEKAKKESLAQPIACRRKRLNAMGQIITCLEEHLSNHCPHAPKVKLAQLHQLHPFQEDSPIDNWNDWVSYSSGLKEYEGYQPYHEAVVPAPVPSAFSWADITAAVVALMALLMFVYKSIVVTAVSSLMVEASSVMTNSGPEIFDVFAFNAIGIGIIGTKLWKSRHQPILVPWTQMTVVWRILVFVNGCLHSKGAHANSDMIGSVPTSAITTVTAGSWMSITLLLLVMIVILVWLARSTSVMQTVLAESGSQRRRSQRKCYQAELHRATFSTLMRSLVKHQRNEYFQVDIMSISLLRSVCATARKHDSALQPESCLVSPSLSDSKGVGLHLRAGVEYFLSLYQPWPVWRNLICELLGMWNDTSRRLLRWHRDLSDELDYYVTVAFPSRRHMLLDSVYLTISACVFVPAVLVTLDLSLPSAQAMTSLVAVPVEMGLPPSENPMAGLLWLVTRVVTWSIPFLVAVLLFVFMLGVNVEHWGRRTGLATALRNWPLQCFADWLTFMYPNKVTMHGSHDDVVDNLVWQEYESRQRSVNFNSVKAPMQYREQGFSSRSMYGYKFFSNYVLSGGLPYRRMYPSADLPSKGKAMERPLSDWCLSMADEFLPLCYECDSPLTRLVSEDSHGKHAGCIYYKCPGCTYCFQWATDVWALLYRRWLTSQKVQVHNEAGSTQWVPINTQVQTPQFPGDPPMLRDPLILEKAHEEFSSSLRLRSPGIRRSVKNNPLFMFTFLSCCSNVDASSSYQRITSVIASAGPLSLMHLVVALLVALLIVLVYGIWTMKQQRVQDLERREYLRRQKRVNRLKRRHRNRSATPVSSETAAIRRRLVDAEVTAIELDCRRTVAARTNTSQQTPQPAIVGRQPGTIATRRSTRVPLATLTFMSCCAPVDAALTLRPMVTSFFMSDAFLMSVVFASVLFLLRSRLQTAMAQYSLSLSRMSCPDALVTIDPAMLATAPYVRLGLSIAALLMVMLGNTQGPMALPTMMLLGSLAWAAFRTRNYLVLVLFGGMCTPGVAADGQLANAFDDNRAPPPVHSFVPPPHWAPSPPSPPSTGKCESPAFQYPSTAIPPHAMLGSVLIANHRIEMAMPDTGSNFNVAPDISYLWHVYHQGIQAIDGITSAHATAMGIMRVSNLNDDDDLVTQDLDKTLAVPTCGTVLFGTLNRNLGFDSWNSRLIEMLNGDRNQPISVIPVSFKDGAYSVATYVHKPGIQHSDTEIRHMLLLASGRPLESVHEPTVRMPSTNKECSPCSPPTAHGTRLSVVDLCCGIGAVSEASVALGHQLLAAVDSDPVALQQYESRFADIPLFGDLRLEVKHNHSESLCDVATQADVCFVNAPQSNYSAANLHSDDPTVDAQLLLSTLEFASKAQPKVLVLEGSGDLHSAQHGHLYDVLTQNATDAGYVTHSKIDEASAHGSAQYTSRMWTLLIRNDVAKICGNFLSSMPPTIPSATLRDCLDPIHDLTIREDCRRFQFLADPKLRNGTAIVATTGKNGPRNAAYSIDHLSPTLHAGDITIFDDRVNVIRRLNLTEKSRVLGLSNYSFDALIPEAKKHPLLVQCSDVTSVTHILSDIEAYLAPCQFHSLMTNSELHCGMGHPGEELSAQMGIPRPKHCTVCEAGNRVKASGSKGVLPRVTQYGHTQHVDFKISSTPGVGDVTVVMGVTDDATNLQEMYPMVKRSEVLHVMRQLKADIQKNGGVLKHIHTDNDSVITSRDFQNFLLEDPAQLLTMTLCPPHHHEYNGRQESRWRILKAIATKGMSQLALVLGDDAYRYWDDAYVWAKDVTNRRKFKRHGNSDYDESPYSQVHKKDADLHLMYPFGSLCTVHDHYAKAHALVGRSGVILGKSSHHSDLVHKVLMLDTKRVVNTMDVTLTPVEGQPTLDFVETDAGTPEAYLLPVTLAEVPFVPQLPSEETVSSAVPVDEVSMGVIEPTTDAQRLISSVNKTILSRRLFTSPPVLKLPAASSTTKYKAAALKTMGRFVIRSNPSVLNRCSTPYIVDRCAVVSDVTVADCTRFTVKDKHGSSLPYSLGDLAYDLNTTKLSLEDPLHESSVDPFAMAAIPGSDERSQENWLNELPTSPNAPSLQAALPMFDGHGVMSDSLFDEKSQRFFMFMSDVAPLTYDPKHSIEIHWMDNDIEEYDFVPDESPHGFHATDPVHDVNTAPPKSLNQIHRLPQPARLAYLKSLQKEYNGLWDRGMFKLVKRSSLPASQPVFPTTNVYKIKYHADGTVDTAKSRVCLRGDLMVSGRDFGEVHSPTTQNESIKLILSECPSQGKIAVTYDVQQAFTYGKVDPTRPTYIKQFPGTDKILDSDSGDEMVMKLMNRLYGDPAAPRAFHLELHSAYMDFEHEGMCFAQSKADPCVYYLRAKDDLSLLTSAIFVDDSCNTFVPDSQAHDVYLAFIVFLKTRFTLKNDCDGMDLIRSFLGMNITWGPNLAWVRIDQPHAISKLVEGSGVDTSRAHFTPLPPGTEVMLDEKPDLSTVDGQLEASVMKNNPYRKRLGELLWIARITRPDIAAAVSKLSTVANNPGLTHWDLTTYLIQYLHHTRHLGILYERNKSSYPYGFVDVAFSPHYGNDGDDYRSFEGWLMKNAGGPIAWSARFQKNLALSSSESEYYGLTSAAKQAIHLTELCTELGIHSDEPFLLYEDNKAAIKMSQNTANSRRTVHLDRRAHFIREKVNAGEIQLEYCPTKMMEADALTKIMPRPGFEDLRTRMGLTYQHCADLTPRIVDSVH